MGKIKKGPSKGIYLLLLCDSKKKWVYSRAPDDNLFNVETSHDNKCDTLDGILETEIRTIYGIQIDIDV